ncbi:ARID DNA-binding domain-containing protein, partial [Tanacetum coccineum]
MVHTNHLLKHNWLGRKPVQKWYQSHGSDYGGKPKPIHTRHDQEGVTRGYLPRETPQRLLSWNNRKKSLSPGCKKMLLEKVKEIEAFNASRVSKHVYWKCPDKEKKAMKGKQKEIVRSVFKKVGEKIKYPEKIMYPEKIHVITDYMLEGTDNENWDNTWYVSSAYKMHMCPTRTLFRKLKYKFEMIGKEETEKKFIFSYGIGDVVMETREGNYVIYNVHYTPEVTLNVLSCDLLEEQGYVVEIRNDKCNIHYMFGRKGKEKAHEESYTDDDGLEYVITEHNKFLEKYFKSIEPKDEESFVKGLEDLKWDKDDVQDYVDEEYISWNGSLYALKMNSLSRLDEIPPRVGMMEINLLSLHKIIDNLGGYLCVTLGDKWKTVAGLQGLTEDDGEAMRDCYRRFIDMVQVYYETAERPWYERKLGNEVGKSSSVPTKVEDPQGKDKDKAGIEEAQEALE